MPLLAYPYKMSAHLLVSGEDASDFLQSQFSNELRPFSVGQCVYGLWLDVKGKIVADSWVYCEGPESFRVFSEHCDAQAIKEKLERHIIADDVELEVGPGLEALALIGDNASEAGTDAPSGSITFAGRRSSSPSLEIIFSSAGERDAWLANHGYEVVSEGWIQRERMAAGIAQVMCEALPGDLPGEAGLEADAVSFTKGCFLGQEVVARMHNVGRPQKGLYLLSGAGEAPAVSCSVSNSEEKILGSLRSSVGTAEGWQGVAMLKSRYVESGMDLRLEDGRTVKVESAYKRTA